MTIVIYDDYGNNWIMIIILIFVKIVLLVNHACDDVYYSHGIGEDGETENVDDEHDNDDNENKNEYGEHKNDN